jgi:hypothetical protein
MGPAPGGAGVSHVLVFRVSAVSRTIAVRIVRPAANASVEKMRSGSGVRADVPCPRTFRRRLLIEADALTFVQLLERAGLHRAAVKEPLLAAIVADESESAIADQPFNRAVRHVDVPPQTVDGPS